MESAVGQGLLSARYLGSGHNMPQGATSCHKFIHSRPIGVCKHRQAHWICTVFVLDLRYDHFGEGIEMYRIYTSPKCSIERFATMQARIVGRGSGGLIYAASQVSCETRRNSLRVRSRMRRLLEHVVHRHTLNSLQRTICTYLCFSN